MDDLPQRAYAVIQCTACDAREQVEYWPDPRSDFHAQDLNAPAGWVMFMGVWYCPEHGASIKRTRELEVMLIEYKEADADVLKLLNENGYPRAVALKFMQDVHFHAAMKIAFSEKKRADTAEAMIEKMSDPSNIVFTSALGIRYSNDELHEIVAKYEDEKGRNEPLEL